MAMGRRSLARNRNLNRCTVRSPLSSVLATLAKADLLEEPIKKLFPDLSTMRYPWYAMKKCVYTRPLNDQELRSHLEHGDTITFSDAVKDWERIERQIKRLGFGSDISA